MSIPIGDQHPHRPYLSPQMSRRDLALEAGYDPSPGDDCTPLRSAAEYDALPFDHPSKVGVARHEHAVGSLGCRSCGERCEVCDERMCAEFGPEPQAGCGAICVDCRPCPCTLCADARRDAQMEADAQASRDAS